MPFDLRVGHLCGRLPSCIVSWFRFGPQQRCFVLGRCLSCGAVAMVFIMETGLWRPENAHFFALRGRLTASAVYHPHVYGQKAELHLSADPLDPCTR